MYMNFSLLFYQARYPGKVVEVRPNLPTIE
jgi:hypothetical protein